MQKKSFQNFSFDFDIQWQKTKQKNRQEDQKTRQLLESIRINQEKSLEPKKKIQSIFKGSKNLSYDLKSTSQKIDIFKKQYSEALQKLTQKIVRNFQSQQNFFYKFCFYLSKQPGRIYQYLPQEVSMKFAVQKMLKYDKILIITGAELYSNNNIPTYRGKGNKYNLKIKTETEQLYAQQVLTRLFYEQHGQIVWKWYSQFNRIIMKQNPRLEHILIDRCCKILKQKQKEVTLITENIDGLHLQVNDYSFYEIHGNVKYMRCQKFMHLEKLNINKNNCAVCGSQMRPHILFLDQVYQDIYGGKIKDNTYDFILSVGANLNTKLCREFLYRAKEVIEISSEPQMKIGRVYTFKMRSIKALQQMEKELQQQ